VTNIVVTRLFVFHSRNATIQRMSATTDTPTAAVTTTHTRGILYLIATPIGNLEDISARALRLLGEVDLILCEDTRHTGRLLHHFGIKTRTLSYHEHNETPRAREAIEMLASGRRLALVSDAGTPAINDPGFPLVRLAIEQGLNVIPIPGACAFVNALIASGLPTDQFFYAGFLPAKSGARRATLLSLRTLPATLIFYEAPHRIHGSLNDARDTLGNRRAVVARELTKLHEQFLRGTLDELATHFADATHARGEMVVLIEGATDANEPPSETRTATISERIAQLEATGTDSRQALKQVARELGLPRAEAYRRLVAEKNE
jgi:16S rRNA (cytidine1402-2'-O)-methyltransferase